MATIIKAKPRSREAALKAWKTRRKKYHHMTAEEIRLRRNKLSRWRYKNNPTIKKKHDLRTKRNNKRIRKLERIRYWKNPEKFRNKSRDVYRKEMSNPTKRSEIYKRNKDWTSRNRQKSSDYRCMWNYFKRNSITSPTQKEKEIYQWLHMIRKEKPKGRSRELKVDNATLEKKLQALYRRLESNLLLKSSIKMQQR